MNGFNDTIEKIDNKKILNTHSNLLYLISKCNLKLINYSKKYL